MKILKGLKEMAGFESVSFIAIGKKGQQFLARTQQKVVAAFPAFSVQPSFRDILPVARLALQGFNAGTFDHVMIMYSDFISALSQLPAARMLLPLSHSDLRTMIEGLQPKRDTVTSEEEKATGPSAQYVFEPSPEEVLSTLLPQVTELQIYQALLEAAASEHSARMVAMRNATDSATDIIDDLTLMYNQTRQAKITSELAELSAGAAALG